MAGAGYRNWTPGDIPTATQFDTFLQEQTVMVFATAAARDTALATAKAEGMVTYQLDTNTFTVYSGTTWSTIGPVSLTLTSWTPTVTQSGSVTVTNTASRYMRVGRWISGYFFLTVTGSGTASNPIIIGALPATAAGPAGLTIGAGGFLDSSAAVNYDGMTVSLSSTTAFDMRSGSGADVRLGSAGGLFAGALASGDVIKGTFSYEAAADA